MKKRESLLPQDWFRKGDLDLYKLIGHVDPPYVSPRQARARFSDRCYEPHPHNRTRIGRRYPMSLAYSLQSMFAIYEGIFSLFQRAGQPEYFHRRGGENREHPDQAMKHSCQRAGTKDNENDISRLSDHFQMK